MSLQLPLTPRQEQVARLIASGLDQQQIAGDLGIHPEAVRSHVNAIADKLDNPKLLTPMRLVRQWAVSQDHLRTRPTPD